MSLGTEKTLGAQKMTENGRRSCSMHDSVVMFTLFLVRRVLTIEVVEYSLSCRVLTLANFSKLVEYSLQR